MPPSINVAYAGTIRRYKSPKYKKWIEACHHQMTLQVKYKCHGTEKFLIEYSFYSKWHNKDGGIKTKDVGNYIKLVDDYLPKAIKGFDDAQIFEQVLKKCENDEDYNETVKVTISEFYTPTEDKG